MIVESNARISWFLFIIFSEGAVYLLIGNKTDLNDSRQVSFDEANDFANSNGMVYFETSAKNASNIQEAFLAAAIEIQKRLDANILQRKDM